MGSTEPNEDQPSDPANIELKISLGVATGIFRQFFIQWVKQKAIWVWEKNNIAG